MRALPTSVPIPKFAQPCRSLLSELRNHRETSTSYHSSVVFGFEVRRRTRGKNRTNFKSTTLPRSRPFFAAGQSFRKSRTKLRANASPPGHKSGRAAWTDAGWMGAHAPITTLVLCSIRSLGADEASCLSDPWRPTCRASIGRSLAAAGSMRRATFHSRPGRGSQRPAFTGYSTGCRRACGFLRAASGGRDRRTSVIAGHRGTTTLLGHHGRGSILEGGPWQPGVTSTADHARRPARGSRCRRFAFAGRSMPTSMRWSSSSMAFLPPITCRAAACGIFCARPPPP